MATKLEKNRQAAIDKGYVALAQQMESQYGMPPGLFAGLLEQESAWNPDVISGKKKSRAGAIGIAQFMPATAEDEGVDPLDPEASIRAGAKYLARLKESTGSWTGALTSYNWGIGNYRKWVAGKKKRQPKEAREYAGKVQGRAATFRGLQSNAMPAGSSVAGVGAAAIPEVLGAQLPEATAQVADTSLSQVAATPSEANISEPLIPSPNTQVTPSPEITLDATGLTPTPAQPMPAAIDAVDSNTPSSIAPTSGALIPPPDRTSSRVNRKDTLELKAPKSLDVTINTPAGPRQVQAETPEEEQIIQDLAHSGETQLLALIPELIQTRDLARSAPLIRTRGDSVDRLLTQIVDGVT